MRSGPGGSAAARSYNASNSFSWKQPSLDEPQFGPQRRLGLEPHAVWEVRDFGLVVVGEGDGAAWRDLLRRIAAEHRVLQVEVQVDPIGVVLRVVAHAAVLEPRSGLGARDRHVDE